jgi:hypothetical protein
MCVISMCNNNNGVMCENINDNNATMVMQY